MENTENEQSHCILRYMIDKIVEDLSEIKQELNILQEKVNVLEKEDKNARVKIIIFLIILIFTYITACIPKLVTILETIAKFI